MKHTLNIQFFSCVGGGPHARLAGALERLAGMRAKTVELFSAQQWRALFSKGGKARFVARAFAFGAFPIRALGAALRASFIESRGKPLERPVLVATTNPFFLPHFLTATRWLHRCAVVALFYDMYPDALEAAGFHHPFLCKVMERSNVWLMRHADGVVHIGDLLQKSAHARYPQNIHEVMIPTGGDSREFQDLPHGLDGALLQWLQGKIVFSYVGNMGRMHDVETFQSAVPEFLSMLSERERQRVAFVFAASGSGKEALFRAWHGRLDENVRWLPPLPDDQWADLLRRSDVALASLTNAAYAISIPSKIQSAICAGAIPFVVAPSESDIARLVQNGSAFASVAGRNPEACGVVVSPGDVGACVHALKSLLMDDVRKTFKNALKNTAHELDVSQLAKQWGVFLQEVVESAPLPWSVVFYTAVKRAFDITVAAGGIVAMAPVMAVVAVAVRVKLGRPVFFLQERPGLHGKPFKLIKFRSMKMAPEHVDAALDAQRLTPFGKKMRALSLDELPTLFNVLKGDMGFVGPRPLLMAYLARYNDTQRLRHEVKPGITGWAQIHGRNAISWQEKFALDVWYVRHASLALDVKILCKTFLTVFKREGIAHAGCATMPEFMGNSDER